MTSLLYFKRILQQDDGAVNAKQPIREYSQRFCRNSKDDMQITHKQPANSEKAPPERRSSPGARTNHETRQKSLKLRHFCVG